MQPVPSSTIRPSTSRLAGVANGSDSPSRQASCRRRLHAQHAQGAQGAEAPATGILGYNIVQPFSASTGAAPSALRSLIRSAAALMVSCDGEWMLHKGRCT